MKQQPRRFEIQTEFDGKKRSATYYVEGREVIVEDILNGRKSAQIGGSKPELLAQIMLREILQEAKSQNRLL